MNYQKGFIAPLLIALITILLIGGGAYVYVQNKQANQSVVEGNTQVSSTGTAFAIPIQGDVKTITEDFIPFTFNESQFQQLPDAIVIKLKGENSPAIVKDISLTKDNWHAPVLYLPLKIGNGLYDVEVFAAEYDMDRNNLTPLYKTKISVERKITDNTLVSVEQKYPAQKDSWEGINVQPLTVGGETNFLKFEISNKTNSVMHIQAFEMGTEAGGRAGFIKSFSIYDVSSGKKLSTLSDLFQTSGTIVNYNLYYLNTAVEIPPGKSLQTELRGVIIPELLPSTFKSKPAFFFYQVFVEVGGDVVRKEVYMTPRAVIEQSAQATSSPQTSDAIVFVPGMSQYTDAGFGFSFWYPSEWVVKQIPTGNTFTSYPGGTVSKALSVSPANSSIEGSIMIKEFSSPTKSITDPVLGCPMGNCTDTVRYYFDTLAHTWMLERPDGIHSLDGTRTTVPVAPANVSNNTMGGLHMFHGGTHGSEDTIIPLSAQNFLILSRNYTTSSAYYQDPIAKTIVATDSTVAPRASTNEQIATIQAEAKAYGVQWQTISAPISVVGSVFNSVRIKDSATFLFTDNNNKIWTVNYQNTSFSEYSGTEAVVHGTDGLLSTVFQDWLKIQKHVGDPPDQSGAPGSITITGMLNVDGVLIASSIKVTGQ